MGAKQNVKAASVLQKDDLIVIGGAGGFIAGSLARYFHDQGFTRIRGVDKKPLPEWYQRVPGVECLCLDLSNEKNCRRACEGAVEVYNLAADMGGMGFIERFRIECLRSILINTHMIESAYRAGVRRYFFSSSACAYNVELQKRPDAAPLKESDAYPAMAERGYGWEKLMSEMFCQEYWAERGFETHIARFHNVYGPCFDDLTEVLTDSGWKFFRDLLPTDRIASRSPETGNLEYAGIAAVQQYQYRGPMHLVEHPATSQCVTPDHAVFATWPTTRGTATRFVPPFARHVVRDVAWDRARLMFTSECRWQGEPLPKCYCLAECRMSDGRQLHPEKSIAMADWFALAGWYLSEGSSWITPRNYTVSIVQAPGAKQKEIVSLLERMDFTPYVNGRNITVSNKQLYTALQQLGQGAATKRIPRWMLMAPRALLERLRNALMLGDGDATGRRYSTVSRGLADDVMELMLKLGRHAWVGEEMRTVGQTVLPIFRVHLSTRPQMVTKRQHRSIIPYTGTVYDVTLDKNHVMMVRRKGRPVWSGNCGTWDGGREKAPAAICRKVIEAKDTGSRDITIWGDGHQTRSFMYIDDCTQGIDMIMHCDRLIATPINLGSNFLISVNDLVSLAEEIGGVKLNRHYDLNAPKGVGGRNSDNTFIQQILGWEPGTPLKDGLRQTYAWIERQYQDRKAGKRTVS